MDIGYDVHEHQFAAAVIFVNINHRASDIREYQSNQRHGGDIREYQLCKKSWSSAAQGPCDIREYPAAARPAHAELLR